MTTPAKEAFSGLKTESTNSPEQRSRLVKLSQAGEGVRGDVRETLETDKNRELSPEQADQLLRVLKVRLDTPENDELRKTVDFAVFENSLRAAPEKMFGLFMMEETGGEVKLVGFDGDEFSFEDRCKESPSGRRGRNAHQAMKEAEEWGVDVQRPVAYVFMQESGEYDLKTRSLLKTSKAHIQETGRTLGGDRFDGVVRIDEYDAKTRAPILGWRASVSVKVKKV